jgi:hypothetical protein
VSIEHRRSYALVIERLIGVRHHPAWVWALLRHRLGWRVQRPKRRVAERDQAAVDRWVKERWPAIKQAQRRRVCLVYFDESALSPGRAEPGSGNRPCPPRHRPRPTHAVPALRAPAPCWLSVS